MFYTMEIHKLNERQANILEVAFKDRDVIIDVLPPLSEELGVMDVTISNIHPVTMTPLIMWVLHHIDKCHYEKIEIS